MPLSTAQLTTLKAHIDASGDLNTLPDDSDGNAEVARLLNLPASPAWTVWKKLVSVNDVGNAFNATELAGLTSLNTQRLQNLAAWLAAGVNPSLAPVRQFFDDVFSGAGGTNTRAALLALWKEAATRAQKLFSTGTGSSGSPATTEANISQGFRVTASDVDSARNMP
jgi:hypothetical protein